jgi:DNA excision repair protein ERCC-4
MEDKSFVPQGLLPSYLAEIFGQLYNEDGLVVLGKGLQSDMLLASLVRFYADLEEGHYTEEETKKKDGKPPLVLVLGLHREAERTTLLDILTSWGTPPEVMPTILTNEAGQSKERAALYQQGGVFVITSRILIVDLLSATIDSMQVDGLLVAHAEQVTETSTEAFIIRIIQSQRQFQASSSNSNSAAFVKAISESPEQVMSGFSKVDKILKALHVQRLYLYPRFHDSIREELEGRNPPKVIELHQELSPLQKEMQQAIAVALQTVIRKLKESKALANLTLLLDGEQFTVENLVTNPLDQALSRNLEHDWHRLSPETKQLIQDLRTLRTLFQNLLTYDCVSFYKLLLSIQSMSAASRHPSMWLLTPAADVLFRKAKERLFTLHRPLPTKQVPNPVLKCQPVLEESPKWRLLRTILSEIREKFEKEVAGRAAGPTNILILVKDDRTMAAMKDYLVQGNRALLFRWLRFLEQQNDRSRSITVNGGVETLSEESRVLLEEESRCRRIVFGDQSKRKRRQNVPINHIPDFVRKRRRITRERARGEATMQTEDLERNAVLDEAVDLAEHDDSNDVDYEVSLMKTQDDHFTVSFPDELRIVLKSYASLDQASLLLQDLSPRYVLFYDTDITFVRAVEIHAAMSDVQIEVYFLMFQASAEDKIFMKSLEREQNTFERLINHKKIMSPPALHCATITQEMQHALARGSLGGSYMGGSLPLAFDSRKGRKEIEEKRDIAVDVREFRSVLPSILHQGGMRLAPVTLIVGDFVLSSVHCVERKSISDLFGSFASGRLYTQVESMVKYYKVPCLLIEFDPAKSFSLQNASEIGVEIRTDSVCSKICLLTMHFPQLRILWSKSPHDTLKIFKDLKRNHDEVDVERAMEIGRNELEDSLFETSSESDEINEVARDMLLRLPGVNIHSARKIMQNCDCLAELCDMSRDELRRVAGPVTGQKLFTFFRQKMSAANI